MENFFEILLTEKGMTAVILFLVLFWIYKITKFLWIKAIDIFSENLKLQRESQDKKDLKFLESVWKISQTIKTWDDEHKEAHQEIRKVLINWHNEIKEQIENWYKKLDLIIKK